MSDRSDLEANNLKLGTITNKVVNMPNYLDTSDATALAGDIMVNKTAYVNGIKIEGTIPNNGTLNYSPMIIVQNIPSGFTTGGTIGAVTSSIDVNISAENIKNGVNILGVVGNLSEGIDTSDADATVEDLAEGVTAYVNGVKLTGTANTGIMNIADYIYITDYDINTISVSGKTSGSDVSHLIYPNSSQIIMQVLKEDMATYANLTPNILKQGVNILGVVGNLSSGIDTSDATAIADDILEGKTAYVNGVKLTGTMENLSNTIAEQENIIANLSNLVNSKASGSGGNTIIPNGLKFAYSTLQNIPAYDMSEITDASKLFYECTNLTNFPVLGNNIINMSHTFYNCRSLNIIENINTTKATDMSSVCGNCVNLTVTPDFDTSNVTNLFGAFKNCSNLTEVSIYNLSVINTMTDIFAGCDNLSLNAYANIVNMLPNANNLTNQYIRNMGISSSVFTEEQINILSNKGYLDFEPQTYYDIYYG